jgi:hypothetical protein
MLRHNSIQPIVTHTQPHDVSPSLPNARVILAIKNFASIPGVCHIGLGVTATNTMKVLRRAGVHTEAWSIDSPVGKDGKKIREAKLLWQRLAKAENDARKITHVIVSSPAWIQPIDFYHLSLRFPDITFVQLNHSGCAYLSIDKFGIRNIRDVAAYQEMTHNIRVAANNERVARFIQVACGVECLYLPNLYDTESFVQPIVPQKIGSTLRIGSFGASRPWKNQLCAAEAAVMMGKSMGLNIELYVNSKRPDGGERMIESRAELFSGMAHAKLVDVPWAAWPKFRDITANMHLVIQNSFDETFNVVTADSIAEGVPVVTSSAIEWTPTSWWAQCEDPNDIMRVGIGLLHGREHAVQEGRTQLKKYVGMALHRWKDFAQGLPQTPF